MLATVKRWCEQTNYACRVVILVGNLEHTHFRDPASVSVSESIAKLEKWFRPAIDSNFLDIRQHVFSQNEVDEIIMPPES